MREFSARSSMSTRVWSTTLRALVNSFLDNRNSQDYGMKPVEFFLHISDRSEEVGEWNNGKMKAELFFIW